MIRAGNILDLKKLTFCVLLFCLAGCGPRSSLTYHHDPDMDFGAVRTVAVMPFENLARDKLAAQRVTDIFANSLMATGAVYVMPRGEVARAIARVGIANASAPSKEEIVKLAGIIKVDAVITGVVTEYGDVRSGAATANVISFNLQMIEIQKRKVVWTASTTKGGIGFLDRLFGSGGQPMNNVTMAAIDDILNKLFQ
jgi:hypothetical protein